MHLITLANYRQVAVVAQRKQSIVTSGSKCWCSAWAREVAVHKYKPMGNGPWQRCTQHAGRQLQNQHQEQKDMLCKHGVGAAAVAHSLQVNACQKTPKHSLLENTKQMTLIVINGPYRNAQDKLLWRNKTCPVCNQLMMSW